MMAHGKRRLVTITAAICLLASPSFAAKCSTIEQLLASDWSTGHLANATCQNYVTMSGKTAASCFWSFEINSPQSSEFSDHLWAEVTACRAGQPAAADTLVNHPDSYDLRQWITLTGTFAISLKRKSALGQSLVHIRFEPATDN